MSAIIFDTNIISNLHLPVPPSWLLDWFATLPPESVVIPWTLIYETEYGIRCSERYNPEKAAFLLAWFEDLLQKRMTFIDMTVEGARLLGRMAACRALRHVFETPPLVNRNGERIKNDKIKLGADAMIAAMSIAHNIPIATSNLRDFVNIHSYFPIPGLYDPQADDWVIDPPVGWGIDRNANDDRAPEIDYRLRV
ncbi:type II toxin-antitoxin system VapC family toxin [Rhizobium sp.]|uniref:type II toxin-antitoxin system VapC family toxin n=1 Tax=Rhizobium sp. TaxID=391 RepID=UPI0034C61959